MATKLTALFLAICGLLAASCGPKKTGAPSTQPAGSKSATDAAAPKETAPNTRGEPAEVDPLKRLELELAEAKKDNRRLRRRLEDQEAARASLEERYAGLEIELASSVEEVLRSKAGLRSVHNRALAISRIAEVRVQLQSVPQAKDPEVAVCLERANDFLNRADKATGGRELRRIVLSKRTGGGVGASGTDGRRGPHILSRRIGQDHSDRACP